MTVKLLTNYPPYVQGNLFTSDAATEAALIAAKIATSNLTGGTTYVAPVRAQRASSRARTAAQLAGVPLAGDISMDSDVYLDTDPSQRYVVNAAGTAYVQEAGGTGGAFSGITGQPTDNANLASALKAKLNLSLGWNGTTPALASGTDPITAGFGSNSFIYTGAGTSPALDGVTGVNGDVFMFGVGGSSTWSVTPKHDPALPAANVVGLAASATTDTTNASNITSGTLPVAQTAALTGDVTKAAGSAATTIAQTAAALNTQTLNSQTGTTYTFVLADAGQNVDLNNASAITATIPPHSSVAYPIGTLLYWRQWGAGAVTIAAGAGVTLDKPSARSYTTSAQKEGGHAYQWAQDFWSVYNA